MASAEYVVAPSDLERQQQEQSGHVMECGCKHVLGPAGDALCLHDPQPRQQVRNREQQLALTDFYEIFSETTASEVGSQFSDDLPPAHEVFSVTTVSSTETLNEEEDGDGFFDTFQSPPPDSRVTVPERVLLQFKHSAADEPSPTAPKAQKSLIGEPKSNKKERKRNKNRARGTKPGRQSDKEADASPFTDSAPKNQRNDHRGRRRARGKAEAKQYD